MIICICTYVYTYNNNNNKRKHNNNHHLNVCIRNALDLPDCHPSSGASDHESELSP